MPEVKCCIYENLGSGYPYSYECVWPYQPCPGSSGQWRYIGSHIADNCDECPSFYPDEDYRYYPNKFYNPWFFYNPRNFYY